jgi:hypothetical protein
MLNYLRSTPQVQVCFTVLDLGRFTARVGKKSSWFSLQTLEAVGKSYLLPPGIEPQMSIPRPVTLMVELFRFISGQKAVTFPRFCVTFCFDFSGKDVRLVTTSCLRSCEHGLK